MYEYLKMKRQSNLQLFYHQESLDCYPAKFPFAILSNFQYFGFCLVIHETLHFDCQYFYSILGRICILISSLEVCYNQQSRLHLQSMMTYHFACALEILLFWHWQHLNIWNFTYFANNIGMKLRIENYITYMVSHLCLILIP